MNAILIPITKIEISIEPTIKTGNIKLDKLLSKDGGFVPSSVILMNGTSGSGKSTLCISIQAFLGKTNSAYYSIEMSSSALKEQTKNIKFSSSDSAFITDTKTCKNLELFLNAASETNSKLIIIDSLQALAKMYPDLSDEAACNFIIDSITEWTKKENSTAIVISHDTKGNTYKGNSYIKQMTDTQIVTNFNKKTKERKIYTEKNRKGPLGELYYDFAQELGIEFFEEIEYKTKKFGSLHYGDTIIESSKQFLSMFESAIDKKSETYKLFKNEYTSAMKEINKIEDYNLYLLKVVELFNNLTTKYLNSEK